ncbi:uncharacterized protein LOC125940352 isoform X2 [Dermacentor silvarum]|uniref:uncharacterized protein LOC125940352 isoform X2 n=1 Tax=Dermacentor silvarum TaxID=543639 RepID=UPI002101AE07|nr:uncharacterized protein LOC125940352 isoform X2 [Dermacentor silvarum]
MCKSTAFILTLVCLQHNAASKALNTGKTFVYPRVLEERSQQGFYTLRVNEQITLNLKKATPFAKRLKILYEDGDNKYPKELTLRSMRGEVYKGEEDHTAVMISFNNGWRVKGIITNKFIINHVEDAEPKMGLLPHLLTPITSQENKSDVMKAVGVLNQDTHRNAGGLFQERQNAENEGNEQQSGPTSATVRLGVILSQQYVAAFKESNYSEISEITDYLAVFFCFVNIFLEKFDKSLLDLQIRVYRIYLVTGPFRHAADDFLTMSTPRTRWSRSQRFDEWISLFLE